MYLYKCDICGHLQEKDEKFYELFEINVTDDDEGFNADICKECFKGFQNFEGTKADTDVEHKTELKELYEQAKAAGELSLALHILMLRTDKETKNAD